MSPLSDKVLIQKSIKKGERVIPLNNKSRPIAIAMEAFYEGDFGIVDANVTYTVTVNSILVFLPGLKKVKKNRRIKNKKYGRKNRRSSSKKD